MDERVNVGRGEAEAHIPLRKSIVERVPLSPETVAEVKKLSLPVNKLTNIPCRLDGDSALPDEWSDSIEHNCKNLKEILPLFPQGWTPLHSASARAHNHCVELLLAAGADTSAQDLLCRTPLDVAGCAHYMGHDINVNNFTETVDLLLNAGGKFLIYLDKSNPLDTPLHTAVELGIEAAVELMLLYGASATAWNSQGITAMHVCVKKRNKELLQILANHECNEDQDLAVVDVKDRTGSTVLCAAVKAEWTGGVCVALGAGASIIVQPNEESPIHIAAQSGNIDIMQIILNIVTKSDIDYCKKEGETALFKAISSNHLDVFKLLVESGSSIEVKNRNDANVLHVATEHGRKEILEYLLNYDNEIKEKLINMSDKVGPPLHSAMKNNHPACAALLISKGARVTVKCFDNSTPLLHIAARENLHEIAKIIIEHDSETIHSLDAFGWTALHVACHKGNREIIKLLLREGADLSGAINKKPSQTKYTPIEILMDNVTKPTELMLEIFDSYITFKPEKDQNCQEPVLVVPKKNFDIKIDYKVFAPETDIKQVEVIKAFLKIGSRYDLNCLFLHPLVQSFLYIRWRSLLYFFYGIFAWKVFHLFCLNMFALSLFWHEDSKIETGPSIFRSNVWIYLIYLTAYVLTIMTSIYIATKGKRILLCKEMWVSLFSITLAFSLPTVVSWHSESTSEWVRLIVSVTLNLNWVEMAFTLARFPAFGYYVLIYGKVANNVFKILGVFIFLIFGFSVSFMILFHAQTPFEDPGSALLTTLVMMASELNYSDIINSEKASHATASLIILRIIFVAFLIMVSIILMNLLVGVAVNDVNNLEIMGNIQRLKKRAEFITTLEDAGRNKFIKRCVPSFLYKIWYEDIKRERKLVLSSEKRGSSVCFLPVHLREAIFEIALLRYKQSKDEQRTMLYQMQLD